MNDAVARVLAVLPPATHDGREYHTLCPAHSDHEPSLDVREGNNGGAVVTCRSGCSQPSILDALATLGLPATALFPSNGNGNGHGPASSSLEEIARYSGYMDESGAPLRQVRRYVDRATGKKEFKQFRWNGSGWVPGVRGVPNVLYNLPAVMKAIERAEDVHFVEGEKDVETCQEKGLAATTSAGGAGSWRPKLAEPLRGANVVIFPDNDEPGRAYAEAVKDAAIAAGARSVKIVPPPGLAEKEDITDYFASGGDLETLRCLIGDADELVPPPPPKLFRSGTELLANPELLTPPRQVIPRLVAAGRVTLLAAREKSGKSTMLGAAAAALTTGGMWLGERLEPGTVFWLGVDESGSDVIQRMIGYGADMSRFYLAERCESMEQLAREVADARPSLLVIDALSPFIQQFLKKGGTENDASAMQPILTEISRVVRPTNTGGVLSHHAPKGKEDSYRGSTAIGAAVDMILTMTEPEATAPDQTVRRIKAKGRWFMEGYSYKMVQGRFELTTGREIATALAQNVFDSICLFPGCSMNDVFTRVGGHRAHVLDAITLLNTSGRTRNDGDNKAAKLYPNE